MFPTVSFVQCRSWKLFISITELSLKKRDIKNVNSFDIIKFSFTMSIITYPRLQCLL